MSFKLLFWDNSSRKILCSMGRCQFCSCFWKNLCIIINVNTICMLNFKLDLKRKIHFIKITYRLLWSYNTVLNIIKKCFAHHCDRHFGDLMSCICWVLVYAVESFCVKSTYFTNLNNQNSIIFCTFAWLLEKKSFKL